MRTGFDHDLYTRMQSEHIRSRIAVFGGKLYLELGGKLFDDFHASRVLPGFKPDSKVSMLLNLKDQAELVVAINADDIEKSKVRGDLGISYDADVLRLIDAFREIGMYVGSVVLTRWRDQHSAVLFKNRLESLGVRVFRHFPIEGYPYDVEQIISDRAELSALIDSNIAFIHRKERELLDDLTDGMTFSDWIYAFCQRENIRTRQELKFSIVERNFTNFTDWLTDTGKVRVERDFCAKRYYHG